MKKVLLFSALAAALTAGLAQANEKIGGRCDPDSSR